MQKSIAKCVGFTLVELVVAVVISAMLIGGVMYFVADTLVVIARTNAQGEFLDEFYSVSSILHTGNFEISQDNPHFDVGLLTSPSGGSSLLLGVIDETTKTLISDQTNFRVGKLAYTFLSPTQIQQIQSGGISIYDIVFAEDKIFSNIIPYKLQFVPYNVGSGDIYDMTLESLPIVDPDMDGQPWSTIPTRDIETYYLSF